MNHARYSAGSFLTRVVAIGILAVSFPSATAVGYDAKEKHPFILFTSRDDVVTRLDREPFVAWFADEIDAARDIAAFALDWTSTAVTPETKAAYAKTLSFAWTTSDSTYSDRDDWAHEAASSLLAMPSGSYKSHFSSDLELSEAVVFWSEAYDCLKAGGFDFGSTGVENTEAIIRGRFKALRDYMARDSFSLFPSSPSVGTDFTSAAYLSQGAMDNHHVKLNAALVVLSLTIYDESGSREDFEHAYDRLTAALATMTVTGADGSPAGGWAEGLSYLHYCAQQYIAAIQSLKNLGIADLYEEIPELAATHLILPLMAQPDGYMPPIDDGEAFIFDLAGLLYSYHAGSPMRDLLLYLWNRTGCKMNTSFRADYIAGFDDTPPIFESAGAMKIDPVFFRPESGFARLGNSWNADAITLFLQSEHGESHTNGQAHEHPDQNSFILDAFGETLILDSGYGGWNDHDATRFAENHNIILVNGAGPPEARKPLIGPWTIDEYGASIVDSLAVPFLASVVSETIYQSLNTAFSRRIVFPERRFYFIHDTVDAGRSANYTLLLHGNGGGTSGGAFEKTPTGGFWTFGGASIVAYVKGSSGELTFSTEDMFHSYYAERPLKTHTVLKASQNGVKEQFLTLLYPFPQSGEIPIIGSASATGGSGIRIKSADSTISYGAFRDSGEMVVIDDGGNHIESDAVFLYGSFASDGATRFLYFADGTFIADGNGHRISLSSPATLALDYTTEQSVGGGIGSTGQVTVTMEETPVKRVLSGGIPVPYSIKNNNLIFTMTAPDSFAVESIIPAGVPEPPSNCVVSDEPGDQGHTVRLRWTVSSSEQAGFVEGYRLYRSRSALFDDPRPVSSFSTVAAVDEWEERHTVLLDSVDAGVDEYIDRFVIRNGSAYYYWIQAFGYGGESAKVVLSPPLAVQRIPDSFLLDNPYPNPFNGEVSIRYRLDRDDEIAVEIFDILGRKTATLDKGFVSAGSYLARWNGVADTGAQSAAGIYFIRLSAGVRCECKRIVYVR